MAAKKRRKIAVKRLAATILVVAAAALIISEATGMTQTVAGFLNPAMHFVETAYVSHEAGSGPQIHATSNGFFLATRDSIRFHNADGTEIFRHVHNAANPVLFGRGDYAAIVEHNGRAINVYNTEGRLYTIPTDMPIASFSLSVQGFAVIIMQSGSAHYIEFYNNLGVLFYYGRHVEENIVPMLADISHDGRFMAISYLDINDAAMNSFIRFISFDRGGADGIFAESLHNPDQIIGEMRFMENGNLIVISDRRIFAVNSADASTIWEFPVNNRISRVAFSDNWFAVAYGSGLLNRNGYAPGTVIGYNAFGTRLFAYAAPGVADSLASCGNNLIVGMGGHFTALSQAGQTLWQLTLPNNVLSLSMLGNTNTVAAFTPTQTTIMRRVRDN